MKFKKLTGKIAIILIICILLSSAAFAMVMGELIDGYEVYLGAGMELSKGVYWTGSDYRTENYIEYAPSTEVYPVVVSGSKVCNYGNFSSMSALLENQGKHVIAGMNGDYFVVATNMPLGIVVENGVLRSSDAGHYAVGFRADGTALIGKPALNISAQIGGQNFPLAAFNKSRNAGQAVLLTDDFAPTTKGSGKGIDLICTIDGTATVNSSVTLTLEKSVNAQGATSIPEGKAILSVSETAPQALLNAANNLRAGDTIKVNISGDPLWQNVKYAVGSLYKLVTDGQVNSGLDNSRAPRSAVGIKADGTVVFYTMDGRQSGHSVGVGMTELAKRMIELGCVEATIMDGGGSTSMNAIYLGNSSASQVNKPSGGYQRSVTNYIMLVTDSKATGTADRLALYPLSTNILAGATTAFTLKAADKNGYSATLNTPVNLSVTDNLGTIAPDGSYIATGEGRGSIIAEGNGLVPASTGINVVKSPDILRVYREGTNTVVTSMEVLAYSSTNLMAQAMDNYTYIISQDSCYTWETTGGIGTIDAQGNFKASSKAAEGSIIVSAGEKSVSIPVNVKSSEKYDDVDSESWYYDDINYVSDLGLMEGVADRIFDPEGLMTRAMAVTVLHRFAGEPQAHSTSGFSDVPPNEWYSDPVYWASDTGVVNGYGTYFDPMGNITREELATMIYRFVDLPTVSGDLSAYSDANEVSEWATKALIWATENGIITGTSATELSPHDNARRAQVATIFARLDKKY